MIPDASARAPVALAGLQGVFVVKGSGMSDEQRAQTARERILGDESEGARAKHLPLLPWEPAPFEHPEPPELVPARMVNEVLYCERLMYLEWAQGEFTDNAFTVQGRQVHVRVDKPGGELPLPGGADAKLEVEEDELAAPAPPYRARSLWLSSEALGLTGKIDVVEGDAAGVVVPIEFKRGVCPDVPEGAYLPERAQLCAQALLLRDQGYRCEEGAIWFDGSKKRVAISLDAELEALTRGAIDRARELARAGRLPAPLVDSPKCHGCSLVGICLPDEVSALNASAAANDTAEGELGAATDAPALRRLHPARDDSLPLYVQEQGARVGLSGELIVVSGKEGKLEARLPNTSQVALFGNVQISTQALRALIERGIPVSFLSTGGWFVGRALGHDSKNVELRMAQHRAAADPERSLALARAFVESKIRNSRTLLRRNHPDPDPVVLKELALLAFKARNATRADELLGLEGTAARPSAVLERRPR